MAKLRGFELKSINERGVVHIHYPTRLLPREVNAIYRACLRCGDVDSFNASTDFSNPGHSVYVHFRKPEDAKKFAKKVVDYRPR